MGKPCCRAASGAPGGRAATQEKSGFSLNLGAHALYRGGAATRVLDELGVRYPGAAPPVSGGFAFDRGRLHTLPGGLLSLLSTGAFYACYALMALAAAAGKLSLGNLVLYVMAFRQGQATACRGGRVLLRKTTRAS